MQERHDEAGNVMTLDHRVEIGAEETARPLPSGARIRRLVFNVKRMNPAAHPAHFWMIMEEWCHVWSDEATRPQLLDDRLVSDGTICAWLTHGTSQTFVPPPTRVEFEAAWAASDGD